MDNHASENPMYLEIVWAQFKKSPIAYTCLWLTVALYVVAIVCPVFLSNKPFLWRVDNGPWQSPWFWSLYDRTFFESSLDVFFNTLLFPGIPLFLVWRGVVRRNHREIRSKRLRFSTQTFAAFFLIWCVSFAGVITLTKPQPKVTYPELQEMLASEGKHVFALYPLLPYSYRDTDLDHVRAPISSQHILGTDNAGRDVFARLVYGTRISLTVGFLAVAMYMVFGTAIGAIAGYYGGWIDILVQRVIEIVISIPSLFLILTVAAFIDKRSIFQIMVIIAAVRWTTPARLVRAEFLRLRGRDFVTAAQALGFRDRTIIFRHILPNAIGPVLVTATFGVASAILVESTMSFLGLGDITVPSWGQILNTGRNMGSWTLVLAPGFAIFFTVSVLNLLGEGLRDALDPKLRQ